MEYYIIGIIVTLTLVFSLRRYFGKKYGIQSHCSDCHNCPYSQSCSPHKK